MPDDGGAEGNRTPDLLIANEALSQLSYSPIAGQDVMEGRPARAAPNDRTALGSQAVFADRGGTYIRTQNRDSFTLSGSVK